MTQNPLPALPAMSDDVPNFSVIVLCWNHSAFVAQALRSLAEQFDRDFEIIFLDNASTDDSFEQAQREAKHLGLQIRWLRNGCPAPISTNLNRLVSACTGDWIAVLSSDDWFAPEYVQLAKEAASRNLEVAWLSPSGWLFFENEQTFEPMDEAGWQQGRVFDIMRTGILPFSFVGCTYNRAALNRIGGWDEAQLVEDRDAFFRLGQHYPMALIPQRLVYYRRSSASASANPAFLSRGLIKFIRKHWLVLKDPRRQLAVTCQETAALAVDQGRLQLAVSLLAKGLAARPSHGPIYRTAVYLLRKTISSSLRAIVPFRN